MMNDAKSLLNQFFGQIQGDQAAQGNRGQVASGDPGQGTGGVDLQSLLSGKGGLATGALAGGVAGLLLGGKKPRKLAKSALKMGGVALVGGLAYKAWRDWQANKPPVPAAELEAETPPAGTPFLPAADAEQQDLSRAVIRSMIAAAKVDGHVTIEEQNRIATHLTTLGLAEEHRTFIEDELAAPLDIDAVVRGANGPEQAAEIYVAALLVVDPDAPAERGYLAMLAARLGLEPGLIEHLHARTAAVIEDKAA